MEFQGMIQIFRLSCRSMEGLSFYTIFFPSRTGFQIYDFVQKRQNSRLDCCCEYFPDWFLLRAGRIFRPLFALSETVENSRSVPVP